MHDSNLQWPSPAGFESFSPHGKFIRWWLMDAVFVNCYKNRLMIGIPDVNPVFCHDDLAPIQEETQPSPSLRYGNASHWRAKSYGKQATFTTGPTGGKFSLIAEFHRQRPIWTSYTKITFHLFRHYTRELVSILWHILRLFSVIFPFFVSKCRICLKFEALPPLKLNSENSLCYRFPTVWWKVLLYW